MPTLTSKYTTAEYRTVAKAASKRGTTPQQYQASACYFLSATTTGTAKRTPPSPGSKRLTSRYSSSEYPVVATAAQSQGLSPADWQRVTCYFVAALDTAPTPALTGDIRDSFGRQ